MIINVAGVEVIKKELPKTLHNERNRCEDCDFKFDHDRCEMTRCHSETHYYIFKKVNQNAK
jgi:hypothetical protein